MAEEPTVRGKRPPEKSMVVNEGVVEEGDWIYFPGIQMWKTARETKNVGAPVWPFHVVVRPPVERQKAPRPKLPPILRWKR